MVFNSFVFAVFFLVFYLLYLLSMRRRVLQNLLMLLGSCYFYACWDWRFLGLIWLSTLLDFGCAWLLDRRVPTTSPDHPCDDPPYVYSPRGRRAILVLSLVVNLGVLGFFKYFDFFVTSGTTLLRAIGWGVEPRLLHVILPVGISFYTFQSMSYAIDVYRGEIRAHRSLLDYAVFVAFFPQLVAGPILRARDFLPQVARARRLTTQIVFAGAYLILWGLFKKVVIADNLALLVDRVFDGQASHHSSGGAALVAVYAFAVQIYCDFSGYTDIARGCGRMMGFAMPLNFNLPYFATNPVDFWRRWHITLSTWLRDYLYIPLGGNRQGTGRTALNLMLTMLLGGLWHGAAWTFVLWGLYHGLLLVAYKALQPSLERLGRCWPERIASLRRPVAIAVFFHFTCLGWLLFRAESVTQAVQMLGAIVSPWPWWILCGANTLAATGAFILLSYALPLVLLQLAQHRKQNLDALLRVPAYARGLAYSAMFYALVCFGATSAKPFIYFQF